jgi:hypothetical protein
MAQNDLQEQSSQEYAQRTETADESLARLKEYGGFSFASNLIAGGLTSLDPAQAARKNIFLKDEKKKDERRKIKKQLQQWLDILKAEGDATDLYSIIEQDKETVKETYNENMIEILKKSRNLEKSFRSIALFYSNSGELRLKNVEFVNIQFDDIISTDSTVRQEMQARFKESFNSVDMRDSYSLLLIPGYMGSKTAIESWAKICYNNKVTMITDYSDLPNWVEEDINIDSSFGSNDDRNTFLGSVDESENQLSGMTNHLANAVVVANEIVARDGYAEVGEKMPLLVGGAGALAGRLLSNNPAQPVAGVKHGTLFDAKGVRMNLTREHLTNLHERCLVPLTTYEGSVIAYGDQSLNNGGDIDFNKYSVVRVYNFISKCLTHYFNAKAYQLWTPSEEKQVKEDLTKFLDSLKHNAKMIQDFKINSIKQDKNNKDVINAELAITPFYPARSFVFSLDRLEDGSTEVKRQ